MKYEILKNYILGKIEKDSYLSKDELMLIIDVLEKSDKGEE